MKTFNCTQCGASIERISIKDRWAHCDYCKTRFMLPEEKRPIVSGLSFGVIKASDPDSDELEFNRHFWIAAICVLGVAITVFSGVKYQGHLARQEASKIEKAKQASTREQSKVTNVPVSVQWGEESNDVLYYELPTLDTTAFALARRVENAHGSKFVVVVQVRTDREGRVEQAEAVSGNIILQQLAVKAARNTVFLPKKKKIRKFSYTFGE